MQKVYGLVCDLGDGSSCIHWFRDSEESLLDVLLGRTPNKGVFDLEDYIIDGYNINEGTPAETFEFPDDLNLEACGFLFETLESIQ